MFWDAHSETRLGHQLGTKKNEFSTPIPDLDWLIQNEHQSKHFTWIVQITI